MPGPSISASQRRGFFSPVISPTEDVQRLLQPRHSSLDRVRVTGLHNGVFHEQTASGRDGKTRRIGFARMNAAREKEWSLTGGCSQIYTSNRFIGRDYTSNPA